MQAKLPGYGQVEVDSPFLDVLLALIQATYEGKESLEIGEGSVNRSLSDFLTFILAYPPGVQTPQVVIRGTPSPTMLRDIQPLAGRVVVLASGGVDSTAALLYLRERGMAPAALWCDYGQPYAVPELAAVEAACTQLGIDLVTLRIDLGSQIAEDRRFGHVIPARNLLIAAAAAAMGAGQVVLAGLADELVVPDKSLRMFAEAGDYLGVPVFSPFVEYTKTDLLCVWRRRWRKEFDALHTVSCYKLHGDCQDCPACAKRAVALVVSGYARHNFPVFYNQQSLIRDSWFPRIVDFPWLRRADLLLAFDLIRETAPSDLVAERDRLAPLFADEIVHRRDQLETLWDIR